MSETHGYYLKGENGIFYLKLLSPDAADNSICCHLSDRLCSDICAQFQIKKDRDGSGNVWWKCCATGREICIKKENVK